MTRGIPTGELHLEENDRRKIKDRAGPSAVRRKAFTRIELAVVIAVLALLFAMLYPTIGRIHAGSMAASCLRNQSRIGFAFTMFSTDHGGIYPACPGWGCVGGKFQPDTVISAATSSFGAQIPEAERPLNKYVRDVNLFHCPADRGDSLAPEVQSAWLGWGNSYQTEWVIDAFRVRHVTGNSDGDPGTIKPAPIKMSEVLLSPANKIIQGDWPWPGNRSVTNSTNLWHNSKGVRAANMLFADNHATFFKFPDEMSGWRFVAPDPAFTWW